MPCRNLRAGLGRDVRPRVHEYLDQLCLRSYARGVCLRLGIDVDVVDEVQAVIVSANLFVSPVNLDLLRSKLRWLPLAMLLSGAIPPFGLAASVAARTSCQQIRPPCCHMVHRVLSANRVHYSEPMRIASFQSRCLDERNFIFSSG